MDAAGHRKGQGNSYLIRCCRMNNSDKSLEVNKPKRNTSTSICISIAGVVIVTEEQRIKKVVVVVVVS